MRLPLLFSLIATAVIIEASNQAPLCKCTYQDCYPLIDKFVTLRAQSRAVSVVFPEGNACHVSRYTPEVCADLKKRWHEYQTHVNSRILVSPLFSNQSCDPFTDQAIDCRLGNYPGIVIDATSVDDVKGAIDFVIKNNVRLIIRNTGLDYLGRSTGPFTISLWMHTSKAYSILENYAITSPNFKYNGPAIFVSAGQQGHEVVKDAHDQGLVVVTPEHPLVGISGGYIQGGGHSPLSSVFGLATDNVLSFDVVLANQTIVHASPDDPNTADLFWALAGGGGGTFGVVIGVAIRAFPDAEVAGASFEIKAKPDQLLAVIAAWHDNLPAIVDAGITARYTFGNGVFTVRHVTAFNKTLTQLQEILKPFVQQAADLGLPPNVNYTQSATYWDHYQRYWSPSPSGNVPYDPKVIGGRMIPREAITNLKSFVRDMLSQDLAIADIVALNVTRFDAPYNSVNPAWRKSIAVASVVRPINYTAGLPIHEYINQQDTITKLFLPRLTKWTPNAGIYMNEADVNQKDWKETFFGSNYDRLLQVKNKYDPDHVFWAPKTVGSEAWYIDDRGALCKR